MRSCTHTQCKTVGIRQDCWKTVGSQSARCENCWKTVGKILAPWCLKPRGSRHHGAKIFPTVFQQFHSVPTGFQQFSNSLALQNQRSCTPTRLLEAAKLLEADQRKDEGGQGKKTSSVLDITSLGSVLGSAWFRLGSTTVRRIPSSGRPGDVWSLDDFNRDGSSDGLQWLQRCVECNAGQDFFSFFDFQIFCSKTGGTVSELFYKCAK